MKMLGRLFAAATCALIVIVLSSAPARGGFGDPCTGYSSTAKLFAPAGASPLLWLEAGAGVTTVSGAVSQWTDSSGSGDANKNVAQPTAGKRPTYNATDAAYGGQPTLSFASASSQMLLSGTWATPAAPPLTVVLVGQTDELAVEGFYDETTTLLNCALYVSATALNVATNGNANAYGRTGSTFFTSPSIVVSVQNGAGSALYINGVPTAAGTLGTRGFHSIIVGALGGQADPINGKIAELLVIPGAADVTQVAAIDAYYSSRFGIVVP
jgi:hypothetical protein